MVKTFWWLRPQQGFQGDRSSRALPAGLRSPGESVWYKQSALPAGLRSPGESVWYKQSCDIWRRCPPTLFAALRGSRSPTLPGAAAHGGQQRLGEEETPCQQLGRRHRARFRNSKPYSQVSCPSLETENSCRGDHTSRGTITVCCWSKRYQRWSCISLKILTNCHRQAYLDTVQATKSFGQKQWKPQGPIFPTHHPKKLENEKNLGYEIVTSIHGIRTSNFSQHLRYFSQFLRFFSQLLRYGISPVRFWISPVQFSQLFAGYMLYLIFSGSVRFPLAPEGVWSIFAELWHFPLQLWHLSRGWHHSPPSVWEAKVSGSPHIPHHLLDTCLQPIVFALQAAILQRCIPSSARPPWHNFWNSRWASIALLQLQQDALDLQPKAHRVRPEHTWRCQLLLIKTIYATIEAQTVFVSTVWCRSNCGFHPSWVSFQLPSRCTVCVQPLWVFHGLKDRWHGCCSKPCAFSLEDDNCTLVRFL